MTDYYVGNTVRIPDEYEGGRRGVDGILARINILGENPEDGLFVVDERLHFTHRFEGVSLGEDAEGKYVRLEEGAKVKNG